MNSAEKCRHLIDVYGYEKNEAEDLLQKYDENILEILKNNFGISEKKEYKSDNQAKYAVYRKLTSNLKPNT